MELGRWMLVNNFKKQVLKNSPYSLKYNQVQTGYFQFLKCAQDLIPSGKPTMA